MEISAIGDGSWATDALVARYDTSHGFDLDRAVVENHNNINAPTLQHAIVPPPEAIIPREIIGMILFEGSFMWSAATVMFTAKAPSVACLCRIGWELGSDVQNFDDIFTVMAPLPLGESANIQLKYSELMYQNRQLQADDNDFSRPFVLWVPVPIGLRGNVSAVAIIQFPDSPLATACTLRAQWPAANVNFTRAGQRTQISTLFSNTSRRPQLAQEPPYEAMNENHSSNPFLWHDLNPVYLSPQWLANASVIDWTGEHILSLSNILATTVRITDKFASTVPTIIATAMAALPIDQDYHTSTDMSAAGDVSSLLKLRFNVFVSGMGYSTDTWPVRLAISVLMVYCVFVLAFSCNSLYTGLSSHAWDSAAEVVALALRSEAPPELGRITAGLKTLNIFKRRVAIVENGDEELEFVFVDVAGEEKVLKPLQKNKLY